RPRPALFDGLGRQGGMGVDFVWFHRVSFSVETLPFGKVGSDFICETRARVQTYGLNMPVGEDRSDNAV
ncbi:hypothetical protein DB269_08700, partial [Neisseria gonorrhoeae]